MNGSKSLFHLPKSGFGRTLLSLAITALVGFAAFYLTLPTLNFQDERFYGFLGLLCIVYVICVFLLSGGVSANVPPAAGAKKKLSAWLRFIKSRCLPVAVLFVVVTVVNLGGQLLSQPFLRAGAYRDLLTVENGSFADDVAQISFDEIPTLDRQSAEYLGDRQMGTLSDMVSQFEYYGDSTQINYQGRPVRVAPIAYADLIKWITNRGTGLPAYVVVDMVSQEATVIRLQDGIKYSFSEPLNRNILRHLRFQFPTMMFSTPEFEIDENGHPWWIAPRVVKTIGLFGGTDIQGAVLCDAVTGECTYYDEVPAWVDTLYTPQLIMQQYDYHGTFVHGFLNSIFGQRDVTVTTDGYNYIAMNDDVYVYTGVTSANADQSNLGFLLCNMRTKETKYYVAPGATEEAAKLSAMGVVQDLGYQATFPLLLNIAGEPTYFIPLKDATELVKMYAMVNVAQYQIVATGTSVSACEQSYIQMLAEKGVTEQAQLPQTQVTGEIAEIRTAVINGNTHYFLRFDQDGRFFSFSAAQDPAVVTLDVGDTVTIQHEVLDESVPDQIPVIYSIQLVRRSADSHSTSISPFQQSYDALNEPPVLSGSGLPVPAA